MLAGRMTAIARALTLGLLVMPSVTALAQSAYPARAIRFITPFPPGGSLRSVDADERARSFRRNGVNRASSRTGRAATRSHRHERCRESGARRLYPSCRRHAACHQSEPLSDAVRRAKEFAPVATIARSRQILVINPSLPVSNLKELIALAKARPGAAFNYGSSGTGNTNHLAGELFCVLANVRMQHIPYKGAGPAIVDLISGQLQLSFT